MAPSLNQIKLFCNGFAVRQVWLVPTQRSMHVARSSVARSMHVARSFFWIGRKIGSIIVIRGSNYV